MNVPGDDALILTLDSPGATLERVGGKGASLAKLATAGLPVPAGFHITTHAYRRFVSENQLGDAIVIAASRATADDAAALDSLSEQVRSRIDRGTIPDDIAASIRQAYGELGTHDPAVAVRSSATAEDLSGMSFAGQQDTYLNVRGGDHVLDAVKRCWASLWTARALAYRARLGIRPEDVSIAVIVQQLVPADAAGILFTANPMTAARGEIMINAAWGLGEAIVGGHVTPDTIIVDKEKAAVKSQVVADKDVMTLRLAEGTREEAVPAERRKQATLQSQHAAELAQLGVQIERLYGQPMDIEWALSKEQFFIVQARPITALPEPRSTLDWTLPQPKGRYARSSVIELLPDPLSPLFATLAVPRWNEAYRGLMQSIGLSRAFPDDYLMTINDYAYYDLSLFSGWKLLRPLWTLIPQGIAWIKRAQERWADEARPRYAAVVADWGGRDLDATPATQLLDGAREIVQVAADHYLTIQSGILPAAYTSEVFFTHFYNRLIKRRDEPSALTFLLGFDSAPILAEKSLYDLAMWARSHPGLTAYLADTPAAKIASDYSAASSAIAGQDAWPEFCRPFSEHLDRFGHAVYDLDFAKGLPADEPSPLLESLKFFLRGDMRSPHERQAANAATREQATQTILARLRGLRLRGFTRLLRGAQRYAPLREDALADVGLGWPIVRRMLHEIGRRLVAAGSLGNSEDVFWLKQDEVESAARALDANQTLSDHRPVVAERRANWERERTVTPPVVLPIKGGARFFGIDFSRWMPAWTDQPSGDTIRGIGASPGRVSGVAQVIHGPVEFDRLRPGEILVAKITTPAWTPLFAIAAGVVTDVGGPLSHSSIVAREYQIPAVLGTGVATERIHSGQRITVQGDEGVVIIGL